MSKRFQESIEARPWLEWDSGGRIGGIVNCSRPNLTRGHLVAPFPLAYPPIVNQLSPIVDPETDCDSPWLTALNIKDKIPT